MLPIPPSASSIRHLAARIRSAASSRLLGVAAIALFAAAGVSRGKAQAFTFPTAAQVGAGSSPVQVGVTIQTAGTLDSVSVVGQGNAGMDFAAANSGTCASGHSYAAGQTCTVGVSFNPAYPGVRNGAIVLTARNGAVLGTQFLSGNGIGALGVFLPGMISTVAGHATWIYNGDGELATNASIFLPFGVAVDSVGNMYIADQGNSRIRKVTAATGIISTIAGNGVLGGSGDGGPALQAAFSNPSSVALDGAGNIFISDSGNNVVRKISATTGIINTVAGAMEQVGYSGDGGLATAATLNDPGGIAIDSAGNLFIADTANNVIRRVDAVTGTITTVAGTGALGFSGDGGLAVNAHLNAPWSITPAAGGVFYIADQGNNRIRKVDGTGIITTVAGTGVGSFTGDLGPALLATLDAPASVALDAAGNMYIADAGNNRVRKVLYGTRIINTIAGLEGESITGDSGPATNAGLYGPYTLAIDGMGNLYIADVFHNRIREVSANTGSVDFDPMRVGRVAAPQPQTLENDGNAPMAITAVQAVSNSVVDATTTTCSAGQSLLPLDTCIIGASFAPTVLGTPVLGSISVTSNASNAPSKIQLSGNVLNQDPATITVSASANPISQGSTVFFTVNVSSDGAVPTGQVTLLDGVNTIGTATLAAGGVATFSVSTLTGGQHSITASYAGDTNNTSGISLPLVETVTVTTAPTLLTLAASANPALSGMPLALTATISLVNPGSGSGTISGSVTFSEGTTIWGTGTVSSSGVATLTLSTLAIGQHSIAASYSGTSSFGGSTSTPLAVTVEAAPTTTTLASPVNPSSGNVAVVLNVSVAGKGLTPTGTVSFTDGPASLGSATLGKTGAATLSVTGLTPGPHTIVATYSGDANNSSSVSTALQQTIVIATSTTTVSSSLNPAPQGSAVVLTASVKTSSGIPTGTVQFLDGAVNLGSATLDKTGAATFSTSTLGLGAHSIQVDYQGDTLDSPSISSTLTERIIQVTTTTVSSSAIKAIAGTNVTWTANVAGLANQPVTGTVVFKDGTTAVATVPVDSTGAATFSSSALAIGSHTITAVYSGDQADQASTSASLVQTITIATTSVTLVSNANPVFGGATLTLTATVSGNGVTPTGTVVLHDGTATLGTLTVSAAGVASLSLTTLTPGSHSLTAVYSGDTNDGPSTSATLTQSVIEQTTLTIASAANPSMFQDSVAITVSVAGGLTGYSPTGAVTLNDGTTTLGSAAVDALGNAHFTLTAPAIGQHVLTASYAGDIHNTAATAPALTQNVILRPTTNGFSASATSLSYGDSVTFISLVQGVGPNFPTGTVTFVSGSTVLGSAPLNANGLATLTFTPPQGSYSVVAKYPGDTLFAASNSTTTSILIGPTKEFVMTVTPANPTVAKGSHTTLGINIVTASTFSDTLAIGCAGLPPSATCTFSTNSIKVSGGSSAQLTVVLDTGDPLGAGASASLAKPAGNGALACILPGGALLALLLLPARRFRKQLSLLAMLLMLCTVGMLSGCANSINTNDTPAGTYTIQVVGTGAVSGATQAGTITLTVTQ
jgi:hypothetical protein